jgi:hypothetical protein
MIARRIYVAARMADKGKAAALAAALRLQGHRVCSGWHDWPDVEDVAAAEGCRATRQLISARCHADLREAGCIVALAHPDCRGTLVELATAYHLGQEVLVIGDPCDLTLMLDLPEVRWVPSTSAALAVLGNGGRL